MIHRELRARNMVDPVIGLTCETRQFHSPELADAFLRGASSSELASMFSNLVQARSSASEQMKLYPALYSKNEVPASYLMILDGLEFCLPPDMRLQLMGCTLDVTDDAESLVLRDSGGNVVLPPG